MKTIILIIAIVVFAWPMTVRGEECKYTLAEIDELRYVVAQRYLWGTTKEPSGDFTRTSRSYREDVMSKVVEERVRTYMEGCIKAEDIIREDANK